jgi:hypothetical protein
MSTESKRIHMEPLCSACERGLSFGQTLHELHVPEWWLDLDEPSTPHRLPWIDAEPFEDDELVITEDGYMSLEFALDNPDG